MPDDSQTAQDVSDPALDLTTLREPAVKPVDESDRRVARSTYHQAEFVALQNVSVELGKSNAANFRYAILASAGIYAWIAGAEHAKDHEPIFVLNCDALPYVFWLPVVVSLFFSGISLGILFRLRDIRTYVKNLENEFGHPNFGWEGYLASKGKYGILSGFYVFGWPVLFLGNVYLAYHLPAPIPVCKAAAIAMEHVGILKPAPPPGNRTASPGTSPSARKN